jgi:hypothetical protein
VRVPDEFANAADAEIVVRINSLLTGKMEAKHKLSEFLKASN